MLTPYFNYCGIRVRDLERSLKVYTKLFGLREVARGDHRKYGAGLYVLLRYSKSGQQMFAIRSDLRPDSGPLPQQSLRSSVYNFWHALVLPIPTYLFEIYRIRKRD